MKNSKVGLIFLIMIFVVVGCYLLYSEITARLNEQTVYVVKSGVDILPNEKITADKLVKKSVQPYYLPADTILDDSMIGMYAKTTLFSDRTILKREVDPSPIVELAIGGFNLNAGERLVSVTVNNAESLGGLLAKGQFVDLHWVQIDRTTQEGVISSLFNHLEVIDIRSNEALSINQTVGKETGGLIINTEQGQGKKNLFPMEVILRVTSEQAMRINLAEETGTIKVVLNPHRQDDGVSYRSIQSGNLKAGIEP